LDKVENYTSICQYSVSVYCSASCIDKECRHFSWFKNSISLWLNDHG